MADRQPQHVSGFPCDVNALPASVAPTGGGDCSAAPAQRMPLAEIVPGGMCLYLFNAVYPYYLTLTSGGWFKWVPPGGGVVMQCPSPVGCVTTSVSPTPDRCGVVARIVGVKGDCPRGHKVGDAIEVSPRTASFCLKALGGLVPFLLVRAKGGEFPWAESGDVVRCAGCDNAFRVESGGTARE